MQRARLKDIAEKVGCSIAVVSHVVNNSSGNISCRQELRERILRVARELDYAPHYASRALKRQHAFTIGVYIPPRAGSSMGFAYESTILMGIERVCREKAYDLLVISTGDGPPDVECANKLNARRVDGLILLHVEEDSEWVFPLVARNCNVVAVNYYGAADLDTIKFDDAAASAMAVAELHKLGHRRIGYIGAMHPHAGTGAAARLEGFLAQCREFGIDAGPDIVFDESFPGSLTLQRGTIHESEIAKQIAAAIRAMPVGERPTALVGYSDYYAMHVMRALYNVGIVCPEQISVVGIDGSSVCLCTTPQLSSVTQPLSAMGGEAARFVIERAERQQPLGKGALENNDRWLRCAQPTYIARESTAVPHEG
ncbi:MAG: LacI family DNA-binding transcriptional regulator [Kiritimatiellia bacterium]|jgi:DNA-binding LacI/PurR family transcriptional regulator